jgi:hypothetical protein
MPQREKITVVTTGRTGVSSEARGAAGARTVARDGAVSGNGGDDNSTLAHGGGEAGVRHVLLLPLPAPRAADELEDAAALSGQCVYLGGEEARLTRSSRALRRLSRRPQSRIRRGGPT